MATARNTLDKSVRFITRQMKRLGLDKTWQVVVDDELRNPIHNAEISWVDHRVTVSLNKAAMAKLSVPEWQQILLHEICHLLLAELEDWAHSEFEISGKLGDSFRRQQEICVDRMAIILVALDKRPPVS